MSLRLDSIFCFEKSCYQIHRQKGLECKEKLNMQLAQRMILTFHGVFLLVHALRTFQLSSLCVIL